MSQFGRDADDDDDAGAVASGGANPRDIMAAELFDDEQLIWADRPSSSRDHLVKSVPMALFGVPFFLFSVFWVRMASSMSGGGGVEVLFPLFGTPFVLVGFGLMMSPAWAALRSRTVVYALTNRRLIIRHAVPGVSVKSWPLAVVGSVERTGAAEGPGSVYFTSETSRNNKGQVRHSKIGFMGISEPKRVEDAIRKQQRNAVTDGNSASQ